MSKDQARGVPRPGLEFAIVLWSLEDRFCKIVDLRVVVNRAAKGSSLVLTFFPAFSLLLVN